MKKDNSETAIRSTYLTFKRISFPRKMRLVSDERNDIKIPKMTTTDIRSAAGLWAATKHEIGRKSAE